MTILLAEDIANPLDIEAAQHMLCKTTADTLEKHYPGWGWGVALDLRGQVLDIRSARLPGGWGFRIKLGSIDPEGRAIMRAGGELLERYQLARGRHTPGATANLERDHMNNPVPIDD
jgi:hypothetical protein